MDAILYRRRNTYNIPLSMLGSSAIQSPIAYVKLNGERIKLRYIRPTRVSKRISD